MTNIHDTNLHDTNLRSKKCKSRCGKLICVAMICILKSLSHTNTMRGVSDRTRSDNSSWYGQIHIFIYFNQKNSFSVLLHLNFNWKMWIYGFEVVVLYSSDTFRLFFTIFTLSKFRSKTYIIRKIYFFANSYNYFYSKKKLHYFCDFAKLRIILIQN